MNLTFMQFLSPKFGLFAGKVYTLAGGDANEFAQDYHTTFMNTALNFNLTLGLVPFSAYGGGIVVLPWEGATFTLSVIDPSGTPTNNDISEAFQDGILLNGQGRVTIKPFGLVGHQLVGFIWSNKDRLSLEQDPTNLARLLLTERFPRLGNPGRILARILERFFPELLVPVQPPNRTSNTWSVYYNFDQFLWSPAGDPTRGIGAFFRFGVSDGVANPIKYAYNVGIGGKGIIPGRPHDTFGIGLGAHAVQRQLRAVPARAPRHRPRQGRRGRDVLQRRDHPLARRDPRPPDHRPRPQEDAQLVQPAPGQQHRRSSWGCDCTRASSQVASSQDPLRASQKIGPRAGGRCFRANRRMFTTLVSKQTFDAISTARPW